MAKTQLERPSLSFDPIKIAGTSSSGNIFRSKIQSGKNRSTKRPGLRASLLGTHLGGWNLFLKLKQTSFCPMAYQLGELDYSLNLSQDTPTSYSANRSPF